MWPDWRIITYYIRQLVQWKSADLLTLLISLIFTAFSERKCLKLVIIQTVQAAASFNPVMLVAAEWMQVKDSCIQRWTNQPTNPLTLAPLESRALLRLLLDRLLDLGERARPLQLLGHLLGVLGLRGQAGLLRGACIRRERRFQKVRRLTRRALTLVEGRKTRRVWPCFISIRSGGKT